MTTLNMFDNHSHVSNLAAQGYGSADFEVEEIPLLYTHDGLLNTVPKRVATKRLDNGAILGVHGLKYKAVSHKEMIDNQRTIIERSDLDCEGIKERIVTANNGARCFIHHQLPAHTFRTPSDDTATLTFLGTNSYDGFFSFLLSGGANQGACMNGQVWTSGASTIYKAKHTQQLNIQHASRVVSGALEIFANQVDLWYEWANTPITLPEVTEFLRKVGNVDPDSTFDEAIKRNRNFSYMYKQYINRYKPALGANKWALYNALTDWSTHAPAARKTTEVANLQQTRATKVQDALKLLAA